MIFIQTKYQYSDRELVEQLTENPYYQYFIGLPGYQEEPPIDAVEFAEKINQIMELSQEELFSKAAGAYEFIAREKRWSKQNERIYEFLKGK